ncbi:MAG TPA: PDZ domain-containing protein [Candidatus Saccharimonadia bacterium]|nr:PDZ domain-containing protein [Candidatus Saccharimonadia bacterium]
MLVPLSAVLLAALGSAHADVAGVPVPMPLATVSVEADPEAMLRREVQDAVARVIEAGAFGDTAAEQIALSVAVPAERVVNVGLLVDSRSAAEQGLPVLGTLAGGDAQRLGLRAGDVLTSINGKPLAGLGRAGDGTALAVARVRAEVEALDEGGTLALTVLRDGRTLELARDVTPRFIPAMRLELGEGKLVASNAPVAAARSVAAAVPASTEHGCGRISVFHVAPRSQDLYAAKILAIDGEIPGTARQDTYRVAPGPHEVEVAEQIDDQDLPGTYTRARRHKSKVFTIDVRPHTTYLVASHLNEGRERDIIRNGYWDPVVWKEIDEACR